MQYIVCTDPPFLKGGRPNFLGAGKGGKKILLERGRYLERGGGTFRKGGFDIFLVKIVDNTKDKLRNCLSLVNLLAIFILSERYLNLYPK